MDSATDEAQEQALWYTRLKFSRFHILLLAGTVVLFVTLSVFLSPTQTPDRSLSVQPTQPLHPQLEPRASLYSAGVPVYRQPLFIVLGGVVLSVLVLIGIGLTVYMMVFTTKTEETTITPTEVPNDTHPEQPDHEQAGPEASSTLYDHLKQYLIIIVVLFIVNIIISFALVRILLKSGSKVNAKVAFAIVVWALTLQPVLIIISQLILSGVLRWIRTRAKDALLKDQYFLLLFWKIVHAILHVVASVVHFLTFVFAASLWGLEGREEACKFYGHFWREEKYWYVYRVKSADGLDLRLDLLE